MSKNLWFKACIALVFVALAVLWLLSELDILVFNGRWLLGIVPAFIGVLLILKGLFTNMLGISKKIDIILGALLLVLATLAFVGVFISENLALPIIAVIGTGAILLCILAVGGKKWDEGDNEKVGYKNYYQRKAEKEKNESK